MSILFDRFEDHLDQALVSFRLMSYPHPLTLTPTLTPLNKGMPQPTEDEELRVDIWPGALFNPGAFESLI